jgi:hypothetical protein
MPPPVAPRDVHAWIKESLAQRCDIGFWNAISNMIFEPRNPFDVRARRKPKTGFSLGAILFAASLGFFYYFNFAR